MGDGKQTRMAVGVVSSDNAGMVRMGSDFRAIVPCLIFSILVILGLAGCASVESTTIYYTPYTLDTFPPKPADAVIPVIGVEPNKPFETIGRLAFSSTRGYRFMRRSIDFNARANGADAVILRNVDSSTQTFLTEIPPSWDYVPMTNWVPVTVEGKKGKRFTQLAPYTSYRPVFRPGYVLPESVTTTAIDAEMIVFKN